MYSVVVFVRLRYGVGDKRPETVVGAMLAPFESHARQPTAATLSPIRTPAFTIVSQSEGSRETHACWSA